MEELSKVGLAVDTKLHDNHIGVAVSEVTKPSEHFDHHLPGRGRAL